MEDDTDIYEDLSDFETECNKKSVQKNQENIVKEQSEWKERIVELKIELENAQKASKSLEMNLYALLRTAKAELARKDRTISELRKELDNVVFRRGKHTKTANYVAHIPAFPETTVNTNHKSADNCFSLEKQTDNETWGDNSLKYEPNIDAVNKTAANEIALVPVTVFSNRLIKRITEEQNVQKIEKQCSKFNGNNPIENVETHVAESDKENGTFNTEIISNAKDIQPSATQQHKEGSIKKRLEIVKADSTQNVEFANKKETSSNFDLRSVLSNKHSGKRAHEETKEHVSSKRIKPTEEDVPDYVESIKKEVNSVYEKGHSSKTFRHVDDVNETVDRRSTRCESRNTWRRHFDYPYERNRRNEYHRTNSRERHHTEDYHRSRIKSTSYTNLNREDRYTKNRHPSKHINYEEKFDKHYNLRVTDTDRARQNKKLVVTNKNNCYKEYEERKSGRKIDEHKIKRNEKQTKQDIENLPECQKSAELVNRETCEKKNFVDERINHVAKNNEGIDKELLSCINQQLLLLQDKPTELEEGEILNTPDNSPSKLATNVKTDNDPKVASNMHEPSYAELTPPPDQDAFENTESIENIGKFICEYTSLQPENSTMKESDLTVKHPVNDQQVDENYRETVDEKEDKIPSIDEQKAPPILCISKDNIVKDNRTMELVTQHENQSPNRSNIIPESKETKENNTIDNNTNVINNDTKNNCNDSKTKQIAAQETKTKKEETKKPVVNRNSNKNVQVASKNINEKIIVYARRRKPVCLGNSNANMIVLINDKQSAIK